MHQRLTQSEENSKNEQDICISCGFCCDGTLFHQAILQPGEKGSLPEKIEQAYFKKEDQEFFKLPCLYFDQKCTIYDQEKAIICSAFRCQLLNDFSENKISLKTAKEIVRNSKNTREELLQDYAQITGKEEKITFRQLLIELGKLQKETKGQDLEFELFNASCNIFESLLIRYFKSEENFNSMKVPPENSHQP